MPCFVGNRGQVEGGVGGAAHCDDEGYGVFEGFAGEDVARVDAFSQKVHYGDAGLT